MRDQLRNRLHSEFLEARKMMAVADVMNGDFSEGLSGWTIQNTEAAQVEIIQSDDPAVLLTPTNDGTAEIIQHVAVMPNTQYRLSFSLSQTLGSYGYAGVRGHAGRWSELSVGENKPGRYSLEFMTDENISEIVVFAQVYRQQNTPVAIDDISLELADAVLPTPDPTPEPLPSPEPEIPSEPPSVPTPPVEHESLIRNGDFEDALNAWNDISSAGGRAEPIPTDTGNALQLVPSAEGTAALLQQVTVEPGTNYRLSFALTSDGGSYGYAGVRGHAGRWSEVSVGDNVSGYQTIDFATDENVSEVTIFLQAYRQQTAPIIIDDIRLERVTNTPAPEPVVPPVEQPEVPPPTELPPQVEGNFVRNGDFSYGDLSGWSQSGPAGAALVEDGVLQLTPTSDETVRVEQLITGLQPKTRYFFAVKVRSTEGAWASFGVDAGTQFAKTNSARGEEWQEKRFIFYTAEDSTQVRLFVEGYQGQPGPVFFDDLRIVEATLSPVQPPDGGWPVLPAPRALVNPGEEMLLNARFEEGLHGWVSDHAEIGVDGSITLSATVDESARLVQDIPFALAPMTAYSLEAVVRGGGPGATLSVSGRDGLAASRQIDEASSRTVVVPFTTSSGYETIRVMLEQYKASSGSLIIESVSLRAQGGEWIDTPQPIPTPMTEVLYDDFSGPLDPERWLIVDKAWGGDNGGLVPENVELSDGKLLLHANGDQYTGDVVGHGDRTTRVGAGIATRDYYASGRYEVRARIPQVLGAASAFWTFHYIEYGPNDEGFWEEPNKIRNSEIDWEFPTALQTGEEHDPISYDYARVNSWGGKLGGEGAHHPGRVEIINDGEYHTYTIDWHTGGDGEQPRVIWLIDGEEVYRHEGNEFGQDNIPFRASRFCLGIWFPAAGFIEQVEGQPIERVGWAGDPEFDQATLEIDWIRITPFNQEADRYEPETWPNGFYATPDEYPTIDEQP
ncbi:MAG: family 16 glycosylhydrolase [Pirellulales bacterium]